MILKTIRFLFRIVVPILVIVFMMAWLAGAFNHERIKPGRVPVATRSAKGVEAYVVTLTREPKIWEAVGVIHPDSKSIISSKIVALVTELPVQAGQRVKKGQLLVRLDDRDLKTRLGQAEEALRRAKVTRDIAQSDYNRDKALVEKKVIPPVEFDHTRLRRDTAVADVARLKQAVQEARVALTYAVINSPYDGVVIDKDAEVGDLAAPGRPLLTMYEQKNLLFEATIPEEYSSKVRLHARYRFRIPALQRRMTGRVKELIPSADPASRTTLARLTIPDTRGLVPGMFGRMEIPVGVTEHILIPATAVIRMGQITMVDVIRDGLLHRRSIQVGRRFDGKIEVLSGLVPGERIAATPADGGGK